MRRPEGFPSAEIRGALAAEFPDLDLDAAVAEFLDYAAREEVTQKGERGWELALRGALRRDRARGLFVRRGPRRVTPGAGGRPAYPAAAWEAELRELEAKEAAEAAGGHDR